MGINRVTKRGKSRIEVRKRWPDGTTFRRYFTNMTLAKKVLAQIEVTIVEGTWQDRFSKNRSNGEETTIGEFSKRFLNESKSRLSSTTFKRYGHSFRFINRDLGHVPFERLDRQTLYEWMHKRTAEVAPATVNRDLTAFKRMYGWAHEIGLMDRHLLSGVKRFKEATYERRVLSFGEYLRLLEMTNCVPKADTFLLRTFVTLLGETGCRKSEALHLQTNEVDFSNKTITFNKVKGRKARVVPMSPRLEIALEQIDHNDVCILTNPRTQERLVDPKKGFRTATRMAEIPWLQIHDLRRFRACQWALAAIPIPTIQKLLGHYSLETTMRYLKHLDTSFDAVREAFARESL